MEMTKRETLLTGLVSEKKLKMIPKNIKIKAVYHSYPGKFSIVTIIARKQGDSIDCLFSGVAKRDDSDKEVLVRGLTIAATRAVNEIIYANKNSYGRPCHGRNDKYRMQGFLESTRFLIDNTPGALRIPSNFARQIIGSVRSKIRADRKLIEANTDKKEEKNAPNEPKNR